MKVDLSRLAGENPPARRKKHPLCFLILGACLLLVGILCFPVKEPEPEEIRMGFLESKEMILDGLPTNGQQKEPEETVSTLAMAGGEEVLDVLTEPSEDAKKAGVLYKDCGGEILERRDGWTKISSGQLTGWVEDQYLLFDEEAASLARETGTRMVIAETASLRIRQEPSLSGDVIGLVKEHDTAKITGIMDDGWVEVDYHQKTGYVSLDHVDLESVPKTGKTVEELMEQKKRTEAGRKTVRAGYAGTASDLQMLAAIVYCEAGNQPYEGKVAVADVVLNRVKSARFPGDINSVIRSPRQFSPVSSGKYDRVLASGHIPESCYQAARDAMSGVSYVGECLFFKNPAIAGAHPGITIGNHVFW